MSPEKDLVSVKRSTVRTSVIFFSVSVPLVSRNLTKEKHQNMSSKFGTWSNYDEYIGKIYYENPDTYLSLVFVSVFTQVAFIEFRFLVTT